MACFLEGRLSAPEEDYVKEHILHCARCAEIIAAGAAEMETAVRPLDEACRQKLKDLVPDEILPEAEFSWKNGVLHFLRAAGGLSFRNYAAGGILRAGAGPRGISKTMLKIRRGRTVLEVFVSGKDSGVFFLQCRAAGGIPEGGLRAALFSRGREHESKILDGKRAEFNRVPAGDYLFEISTPEGKRLAAVRLVLNG